MSDDGPANTDKYSPQTAEGADRSQQSGIQRTPRQQRSLLLLATAGLLFAGWYAWHTRFEWMTLFDENYGDPVIAAYERFDFTGEHDLQGYITLGTPIPDAIPALEHVQYAQAGEAGFLNGDDRVIGMTLDGDAVAYPLKILQWHEIVHADVGSTPILVTYCPLCDSAAVFDRRVGGRNTQFRVSGFLYNNNLLMYEPNPGVKPGLWSQMSGRKVTGPEEDASLQPLPFALTTWQTWREQYPATRVMTTATGHDRDYQVLLFEEYLENEEPPLIAVEPWDFERRLSDKERVLGVWTGSLAKAYPVSSFESGGESRTVEDRLGEHTFTVHYDHDSRSLQVETTDDEVQWLYSFYFAWFSAHPETAIYDLPTTSAALKQPSPLEE